MRSLAGSVWLSAVLARRPPGHQPPPGPCERLQRQVPPGAYLIRG